MDGMEDAMEALLFPPYSYFGENLVLGEI